MNLIPETLSHLDGVVDIRRDIHAHLKLRFDERHISGLIAEQFHAWDIEVHLEFAGTGVVSIFSNGNSNKSMELLCGGIDALLLHKAMATSC